MVTILARRVPTVVVALLTAAVALLAPASLPAQAALPDGHGFVLWNGSAPVASATWPVGTTVVNLAVGRYRIVFPSQGANAGVVHVTAVNDGPQTCQARGWKPSNEDEVVLVDCYSVTGSPANMSFSAIFDSSSAPPASISGRFGYLTVNAAGSLTGQYNSSGSPNSVARARTGLWTVRMPGLGTGPARDGSVQVTAIDTRPARCNAAGWISSAADQQITVACFDAAGTPLDTGYSLSYQFEQSLYGPARPPAHFGYATAPTTGGQDRYNSMVTSGTVVSAAFLAVGEYRITFPNLASTPDNVQVTALGSGPAFCHLATPWLQSGPDIVIPIVICYNPAGARVTTPFVTSENTAA